MKTLEKYKYWVMLSDYDLQTVPCLIDGQRWVYVAYVCQQAVERQLKGMYVYHVGKEAPKTHNLNFLFKKLQEEPGLNAGAQSEAFLSGRDDCEDFLVELMFYYMTDYPFSYKNIKDRFVDEKGARTLYEKTRQTLAWLRLFQEDPGDTAQMVENLTESLS